jgi:Na+/H+ antiporter NhaB
MGRIIDADKLNDVMEKRYKKCNYQKELVNEAEIVKAVMECFAPTVTIVNANYERMFANILHELQNKDNTADEKLLNISNIITNEVSDKCNEIIYKETVIDILSNCYLNLDNFEAKSLIIKRIKDIPSIL